MIAGSDLANAKELGYVVRLRTSSWKWEVGQSISASMFQGWLVRDVLLAEKWTAHCCSLAAAKDGMPFFGPNVAVRGLWSVTRVKRFPYKY